jgi:hypothetical protein
VNWNGSPQGISGINASANFTVSAAGLTAGDRYVYTISVSFFLFVVIFMISSIAKRRQTDGRMTITIEMSKKE